MNNYKVSIIVAFYKSEPFIRKCIESILNQTYKNIEIILVDDGSPDNCGKICDEYASLDNRIKVIHKENGGACEARNYGLKVATGDFISIIDGDDWLEQDYVEYLLNMAIKLNVDFVMSDNIFTTRDRNQVENDELKKVTGEVATSMILYPIIPIGPWNKLYSKKLLDENNITFCVPWSGEGLHFTATVAQRCDYVGIGHRKVYNYRLNNTGSGLTNYNLKMGTNALENIKRIKSEFIIHSKKLENAANWHIWKNYNFVLKLIIATNQVKQEKNLYRECIKNIRKNSINVVINSELSLKSKIKILLNSLFPRTVAKMRLSNEIKALKNDHME